MPAADGGTRPATPPVTPPDYRPLVESVRRVIPGLFAATLVAIVADLVSGVLPASIAAVSIAVLVGLVVGPSALREIPTLRPGLTVAMTWILRLGIVLLGARLSVGEIGAIGLPVLGLVTVTMVATFSLVAIAGRLAGLAGTLTVLLAVGAAICGNSAVIATAPVIRARPREVAVAVAVVTLFGTAAVLAYPAVAAAVRLDDVAYGLWTGIAINDTSQVVAASAAMSPAALEVATVVKLIRNALLAPVLVTIAFAWTRLPATGSARRDGPARVGLRAAVPGFVLAFLAMSGLRSVGAIGPELAGTLGTISGWAILIGLAGVGMTTRFAELRSVGSRPLLIGFGAAVLVGAATLAIIHTTGIAGSILIGGAA